MDRQTNRERVTETCSDGPGTTDQPGEQHLLYNMSVCSPLDTVGVSKVMSLSSFFIVKQDNNRGNKVDNLSSRKKINIRSAVSATVTIPAGSQGGTRETPRDPGFKLHHLERLNCSMEITHFSSKC